MKGFNSTKTFSFGKIIFSCFLIYYYAFLILLRKFLLQLLVMSFTWGRQLAGPQDTHCWIAIEHREGIDMPQHPCRVPLNPPLGFNSLFSNTSSSEQNSLAEYIITLGTSLCSHVGFILVLDQRSSTVPVHFIQSYPDLIPDEKQKTVRK